MKQTALITGITGQDGSYLAEQLLELGYEVHGLVRRVALEDPARRFSAHRALARPAESAPREPGELSEHLSRHQPRTNSTSAITSRRRVSSLKAFDDGFSTMNTNINGTHYMLAALRELQPNCRFYFAGSSEMFGKVREMPQRETTPFHPRSPYGISKVAGFELTRNYREAYGMFCVERHSVQS